MAGPCNLNSLCSEVWWQQSSHFVWQIWCAAHHITQRLVVSKGTVLLAAPQHGLMLQKKPKFSTWFCISVRYSMRKTSKLEASWNVMAHAQKPDFFFRRNGRVHLNRSGRQFSRILAAEVCASAVVMLDTPCSEVVWRVPATHTIRQFPLHFPSRASPCAIRFQLDSTYLSILKIEFNLLENYTARIRVYSYSANS